MKISGADMLVNLLIEKGVEIIFAITGAGNLAIIDAIYRNGMIKLVFSHHEQAAAMEAQGYARTSGKLGVVLVTTGGGTSNVLTGILSGQLDSVPLLVISGNESSFHCTNQNQLRAIGVQGFDSIEVTKPITKKSLRVFKVSEIFDKTNQLIECALQPRKGAVHLDFPMDLQRATNETISQSQNNEEKKVSSFITEPITEQTEIERIVHELVSDLNDCKRPLLYIGNGCREISTHNLLKEIIATLNVPYILSWSAIDLFEESDPLNIGRVGIYGDRATNIILQKSDLLITLGTRLAIPQMGYDVEDFARNATKWYVDIDSAECAKFFGLGWKIVNENVFTVLTKLKNHLLEKEKIEYSKFETWKENIKYIWGKLPRFEQIGELNSKYIHSADIIKWLNEKANNDAIFTTDVGAGLLTGHYMFEQSKSRRLITSQGLGEMGFGLPAAIGAFFADNNKQLICLNTDGGIMMNIQELQLVKEHNIPLKLFIFNNLGYSMIKISQKNLFESRIVGSSISSGISFPNFKLIAEAFDFEYKKISNKAELDESCLFFLNSKCRIIFEVEIDPDQKYLPRLSTHKSINGDLVSPPLEDLDPLLEIDELSQLLENPLHQNSIKLRKQ
jgi:acetolactate synthase-1/2/3 large subunit